MGGFVNGTPTAENSEGVVVGTANGDKIAGTTGNDRLSATGGNNTFYGNSGNDGFIIQAKALANSTGGLTNGIAADTVIYDFGGAGGWVKTDNDFLALTGFGAGSTFTFDHYGSPPGGGGVDTTLQFYTIHDTTTGNDYTLFIHSLDGKLLIAGDYKFF